MDFVFVTGVPHIGGGQGSLLSEMERILAPGARLVYRPSGGRPSDLVNAGVCSQLQFTGIKKRFIIFKKEIGVAARK
jgi:hypothetical protein